MFAAQLKSEYARLLIPLGTAHGKNECKVTRQVEAPLHNLTLRTTIVPSKDTRPHAPAKVLRAYSIHHPSKNNLTAVSTSCLTFDQGLNAVDTSDY